MKIELTKNEIAIVRAALAAAANYQDKRASHAQKFAEKNLSSTITNDALGRKAAILKVSRKLEGF